MDKAEPLRVLFVCMGNICRSPTAEGIMRAKLVEAGLAGRILVDSAGTHDYHVGEAPDARSCRAAARRGYPLEGLRARQVEPADFTRFDYILVADRHNLRALERIAPPAQQHKLVLMLAPLGGAVDEVPDPYYGGSNGFETVLDLLENACDAWILQWRARWEEARPDLGQAPGLG